MRTTAGCILLIQTLASIQPICLAFTINSACKFHCSTSVAKQLQLSPVRLQAVDIKGEDQEGSAVASPPPATEDEDEEWELVEYEDLTESDFIDSEWKVGTAWIKREKVETTWVRFIRDEEANNVAVWGDGAKGTWKIDVASQFVSVSKETFGGWGGKKIWAGPMEDYYYMQGTVRGWNIISPASVLALWQMIRLGVDKEEAGTAPWFDEEDEVDGEETVPSTEEEGEQ